jgi:hypothetical protein
MMEDARWILPRKLVAKGGVPGGEPAAVRQLAEHALVRSGLLRVLLKQVFQKGGALGRDVWAVTLARDQVPDAGGVVGAIGMNDAVV